MHLQIQIVNNTLLEKLYSTAIKELEKKNQEKGTLFQDSGFDLFCPYEVTVPAGETVWVNLEIKCAAWDLPSVYAGKIIKKPLAYYVYPRSSISKTPLRLANSVGIIDSGYRGTLKLALDNIKKKDYTIQAGQRLAQICAGNLQPFTVSLCDTLDKTDRGEGGFGSTGI